jgi:hypothetical protein
MLKNLKMLFKRNIMLPFKQITIVVVAYHGDFALLERCLQSIDKFCNIEQIAAIKIVLNDSPVYTNGIKDIISKFPNLKIDLIPSQVLEPVITEYFNWNTQQLFKLLVSEHVNTEWYLIHDCKDHYTQPVDFLNDCFTKNNQAVTKLDHTQYSDAMHHGGGLLPFNLAHEIACKVWGVDSSDTVKWHLPTTTPFFVKTSMMQSMVLDLRSMLRGFFPYLFNLAINEQRFCTEFLLYSAYCMKQNGLSDYVDKSQKSEYYNKLEQSKDLRIYFPNWPEEKQKHFASGKVWIYEQGQWLPATN